MNAFNRLLLIFAVFFSVMLVGCGNNVSTNTPSGGSSSKAQIAGAVSTGTTPPVAPAAFSPLSNQNQSPTLFAIQGDTALSFAVVEVFSLDGVLLGRDETDENGLYSIRVDPGSNYFIQVKIGNIILKASLPPVTENSVTTQNINALTTAVLEIMEEILGVNLPGADAGTIADLSDIGNARETAEANEELNLVAIAVNQDITNLGDLDAVEGLVGVNSLSIENAVLEALRDKKPPTIDSFFPSDGARNIFVNIKISITFDEPMDLATLQSGITVAVDKSFFLPPPPDPFDLGLAPPDGGVFLLVPGIPFLPVIGPVLPALWQTVDGTIECDDVSNCTTAIFMTSDVPGMTDKHEDLESLRLHRVTVDGSVSDLAGNPLGDPHEFEFGIGIGGDNTAPSVEKIIARRGLTLHNIFPGNPPNLKFNSRTPIIVAFDEPVRGINSTTFKVVNCSDNSAVLGARQLSGGGAVWTFTPAKPFSSRIASTILPKVYCVRLASGITDLAGNALDPPPGLRKFKTEESFSGDILPVLKSGPSFGCSSTSCHDTGGPNDLNRTDFNDLPIPFTSIKSRITNGSNCSGIIPKITETSCSHTGTTSQGQWNNFANLLQVWINNGADENN